MQRECPQGQIQHLPADSSFVSCCLPTRCGRGHVVKPCRQNGTEDSCEPCGKSLNQSRRTSSYNMDECTYWPLDEGCKNDSGYFNENDSRSKDCVCNIEKGLYFQRPEMPDHSVLNAFCQRVSHPCKPGYELNLNGTCDKCKNNYFKNDTNYNLCEPMTDCSKLGLQFTYRSNNSTEDNRCSKPVPVTTPKPKITVHIKPEPPDRGPPTTRVPAPRSTVPSAGGGGNDDSVRLGSSLGTDGGGGNGGDGDSNLVGPILGTVLFLVVVVVVIAVILFCRKRRGLCFGPAKTFYDPEKSMRHTPSLMAEPHQRNKIMLDTISNTSSVMPPTTNKMMNNNTSSNGHIPSSYPAVGRGEAHHNSRSPVPRHVNFQPEEMSSRGQQDPRSVPTRQAIFPGEDHHQEANGQMLPTIGMFPTKPDHGQRVAKPSPRQGILRNGGPAWQYGQNRTMDQTFDSIMREKLQVQMLGHEANMEAGSESDPLLVSEAQHHQPGTRAAGGNLPHEAHFQNSAENATASPPLMQSHMNKRHVLSQQPTYSSRGPEITYAPQAAYVHPPAVVATFTRSSSVIATPEGEMDEDDMEACVPRFSQLLPDMDGGDTSSQGGDSPDRDAQELRRLDESGATQQLRAPTQRLARQLEHPQHSVLTAQNRLPTPSPRLTNPAPAATIESMPDHHIMNLKEQQLEESLPSSSSLNSQLKLPSDLSETEALKTMTSEGAEDEPGTQETTVKVQLSPTKDRDFMRLGIDSPGSGKSKTTESAASEETEQKKQVGGGVGSNYNSIERKHDPSVQTNPMAARDRRRMASGGNSCGNVNTQERQRNLSAGDQPRPNSTTEVKVPHSRMISYEEDEEKSQPHKQSYPQPLGLSDVHHNKRKGSGLSDEKQMPREDPSSSASSVHSAEQSPSRANVYQRSQSENFSSGSDSPHKPPPRSNSEEKPQSSKRPVAKVRPMPASDSPLPVGILDSARSTAGQGNILSYSSSEESDDEEAESDSMVSSEEAANVDECQDEVAVNRGQGQADNRHGEAN
ncbi:hypothetical protein PoB_000080000 [Plakobranchus ocellatus]|uniref:TNFR-Cys domain-containing protein n=1 Tax=Plakobranchus ocellatus TaxID=259542 RepID=A0AAV3XUE2_9GAST|nr:hypothetical protein PoB_000080000 [Plakobranchus ocellatus]